MTPAQKRVLLALAADRSADLYGAAYLYGAMRIGAAQGDLCSLKTMQVLVRLGYVEEQPHCYQWRLTAAGKAKQQELRGQE